MASYPTHAEAIDHLLQSQGIGMPTIPDAINQRQVIAENHNLLFIFFGMYFLRVPHHFSAMQCMLMILM